LYRTATETDGIQLVGELSIESHWSVQTEL